jgi:GDP-D-mannose 3',5'-epimerase
MKKILILGACGFIGGHLVLKKKKENCFVYAVDIKRHEYIDIQKVADVFALLDLTLKESVNEIFKTNFDEVYQLAADMGGAGYIFTGENDANIMTNSSLINLNVLYKISTLEKKPKIFYSSSACIYPEYNQMDPLNPKCAESDAYPAQPDSEYGWEKLFGERLYLSYNKNFNIPVRIARFHNIFGPYCSWNNGKEKAPAALCRKVITAKNEDIIEVWGSGSQTRSFLYIDECLEGVEKLMQSEFIGPVNIGSEEKISINDFVKMISMIENKKIHIKNIPGPTGVNGRNSDNNLISQKLGWQPTQKLDVGISATYQWIKSQISKY